MGNLLRGWVAMHPFAVKNSVGLPIMARPHVYPGPGVVRVSYLAP
jgi:hypothetical protein